MKTSRELRKTIVDLTVQLQKKNQELDYLRRENERLSTEVTLAKGK